MSCSLGVQLYTVRDVCQTEADLEQTLRKVSEIGYQTVQLSAINWEIPAKTVKTLCDRYGLKAVCTHLPLDFYENKMDWVIDYHLTVGAKTAGLGWLSQQYRSDLDTLKRTVGMMNGFDRKLREAGLRFGYHNHMFEFVKYDGKMMMDWLIDEGTFDFIPDTCWIAGAGLNPCDVIRKMGKRASVIHFKDLKATQENKIEPAEIGRGNLDWDALIPACSGAESVVIEQDTCPGDPFESLKISYRYLKEKGFC